MDLNGASLDQEDDTDTAVSLLLRRREQRITASASPASPKPRRFSSGENGRQGPPSSTSTSRTCDVPLEPRSRSRSVLLLLTLAFAKVPTAWHMACVLFIAPPPPVGEYVFAGGNETKPTPDWTWTGRCESADGGFISSSMRWRSKSNPDYLSVATQWGLVCDRAVLVTSSQSTYLFGILVGGAICLKLLPRFGPRRLLLLGLSVQPVLGAILAFSPFLAAHFVFRCLLAIASAFVFTSAAAFCNGVGLHVCLIEAGWSLGVVTLAGLSAAAPLIDVLHQDWRRLYLTLAALAALPLPACTWLLPDSSTTPPATGAPSRPRLARQNATTRPPTPTPADWIALSCLHVVWAVTIVSFFGGLLNVRNFVEGDRVADLAAVVVMAGGAEVAGFVAGAILIQLRKSRRFICLGAALLVGGFACIVAYIITSPAHSGSYGLDPHYLLATTSLLCRVAVSSSLGVLPSLTSKCHVFSCLFFARIFLLTAPFIGALGVHGAHIPVGIYGLLALIAGVLSIVIGMITNRKEKKLQDIINNDQPPLEQSHPRKSQSNKW